MAAIDGDCLLGVDILQIGNDGSTDLLMSKGVIVLNKKEVPIIQVGWQIELERSLQQTTL